MYSLLIVFLAWLQLSQMEDSVPKIIVIGAGAAGIATSSYLLEHNLTNIKILEAESRIGGRINSVKFGDAYVDMGAEWCHGEKGNIVYEMVKDLNLLESEQGDYILYFSSGKQIDNELEDELFDILDKIESEMETNPPENTNFGDFASKRFKVMINEQFNDDKIKLKIAENALDFYQQSILLLEGAFSWFDITAMDYYDMSEGEQNLSWKGQGYEIILQVLMKMYPDAEKTLPVAEKITFNKVVEKILWSEDLNKIQVICTDKSTYDADHVVFTPSVGVLKEKADTMFVPPLPSRKRSAIDKVGFGAVMKVWMFFPDPWWKNMSLSGIGLVWDENDRNLAAKEFPQGPQKNGRSWVTYISEFLMSEFNPTVVSAWITGPLVPEVENLSEEIIKDGLYYVMKKFLGDSFKITKPKKILQTKWYNNPNFKGTYSFQTPQTCFKAGFCAEADLAQPLVDSNGRPVVLFAGEATHSTHFSTVHGAIETGYREAKVLVDLYK